jgi:CBS domain-containing protein
MTRQEVLKMINENLHYINEAKANLYRGKCFVLADSIRVNGFFKTKRGAEGYKKRNDGFSYYDDYTQEMVSNYYGEVFEIKEIEIIDITDNKYFWFKYLKANMGIIHAYNSGDNVIYEAKKINVSEEIMNYIKESIEDIKNNRGLTVVEPVEEVREVVEIVAEQTQQIKEESQNVEESKTESEPVVKNELNIEVKFNSEKNGIELYFSDKPSDDFRSQLKANKFRWAKYNKCWYVKDTNEAREFLKGLGLLNEEGTQENNVVAESEIKSVEEVEIDINNINEENFPISKEISKRENSGHWTFRNKERDHQQEILNYLNGYQEEYLKTIEKLESGRNKFNSWINSFKKRYYQNYYARLRNNADNPNPMVTGRAGRNARKDAKMNSRYDNLMRECITLDTEFKDKMYQIKNKVQKEEGRKFVEAVNSNTRKFEYKTIRKMVNIHASDNYFNGENLQEKNCYMASVNGQTFYILKTWGSFRAIDINGMELNIEHCTTLKDMKDVLNYYLAQMEKKAI